MTHEFMMDDSSRHAVSTDLLSRLRQAANAVESVESWPASQLGWLAENGVLGWVIPREFGGSDVMDAELMAGYQALAEACLTTTFILTQMNAASRRIAVCDNDALKEQYLPGLASGALFATVGISHLSTSRQHWKQPTVRVSQTDDGEYVLSGEVPWVTGAAHADLIVTGGSLDDGRQLLVAVPTMMPGIKVGPPVRLLALSASQTASVQLDKVRLGAEYLVAGPVEQVMHTNQGGTGSLATSALALGLSARALAALQHEADRRNELLSVVESFRSEFERCQLRFATALRVDPPAESICTPEMVRESANSLALRITQALLAASKGAGFVSGHPAERAFREAMFFLVWSCPRTVVEANLRELSCLDG
jgi:alkylation response protein AidB-like acyl-CoA dehydrogenase